MERENYYLSLWLPSRHLQSLLKDDQCNKKITNCQKHTPPSTSTPTTTISSTPVDCNCSNIMHMIHKLLVMAICHCHTFDCWKTIWNLFLEKALGNPQIDWLQTLHLIKADYNLLLKWFGLQCVLKWAKTNHQLTDYQGGCHKGKSAIDLACQKVCTFELIWLLHLIAIKIDIDALACFDMTIKACQNLSCMSQGADPHYIQLHGQTHRLTRYHPKHSFGSYAHSVQWKFRWTPMVWCWSRYQRCYHMMDLNLSFTHLTIQIWSHPMVNTISDLWHSPNPRHQCLCQWHEHDTCW